MSIESRTRDASQLPTKTPTERRKRSAIFRSIAADNRELVKQDRKEYKDYVKSLPHKKGFIKK
jgi:hypothetical protein